MKIHLEKKITFELLTAGSFEITPVPLHGASTRHRSKPVICYNENILLPEKKRIYN